MAEIHKIIALLFERNDVFKNNFGFYWPLALEAEQWKIWIKTIIIIKIITTRKIRKGEALKRCSVTKNVI